MNTDDATIPGFRPPAQIRSRATLGRIAAAAEALLAERGPSAVTVGAVVSRADTSVGSFYARFDDRDAAIRYVQARFWDDLEARWVRYLDPDRWRGAPASAIVADVVRMLVRMQQREAPRLRAFMVDLLTRSDDAVLERTVRLDRTVAERMADLLATNEPVLSTPSATQCAVSGFLEVLSALRDDVLMRRLPASDPDSGDRNRILILTRMYAGLLGLSDVPRNYGALLRLCACGRSPDRARAASTRRAPNGAEG